MSSGCPARPSGVRAMASFSKSLSVRPAECAPSVIDQAWVDGVHANLAWRQFLGQRFRNGIYRTFG